MWLNLWVLLFLPACPEAGECKSCQTKGFYMLQHHHVHKTTAYMQKALAEEGTIVQKHGFLKVVGNKVTDASGAPVRLRGMSLFWSQWKPQFWTKGTTEWLKKDWGVTLIRAAMAVESGGYLTNKETELKKVKTVVDAAIDVGIYVIIDWHDHNAEDHEAEAAEFFREMAMEYGEFPNVIFEIYNEPIKQSWSQTIKPYHERIVSVIREYSSNLIVLGTKTWSQDVDEAAQNPVQGENLAYTIHFYANTHKQELRDKVTKAVESVAVFATEWGTCDASGDGTLNFEETKTWLDFFERLNISDANWAVSDKQEACSALLPGASGEGGWKDCELTKSGHFVRAMLRGEAMPSQLPEPCPALTTPPPGQCSDSTDDCSETMCCNELGAKCYQKNDYWASCKTSCTEGIDPTDPPEFATPWTCKVLTKETQTQVPSTVSTTASSSFTTSVSIEETSVVKKHGFLKVVGNKVTDASGAPVRLRGMSLFWSQWKPQFWTKGTTEWLKKDWGVTLIRAAMAVESGGYLTNKETELKKVKTVVDAAIDVGIYVIIDWHDHNAEDHEAEAAEFFREMAMEYGEFPNVIFEIYNEPIKQSWSQTIKPYHERIVSVFREYSSNLIVLGTKTWSQDVDEAAQNPVQGENLAYTIHFYANTHKQELRDKVTKAVESVAVFATEWGTCDASGDGTLNFEETKTWLDFFERLNISDANWAVSDKQEACSALLPGASGEGGWKDCELTKSGHFVRAMLRGEAMPSQLPEPCPALTTPPPGQCSDSTDDCSETMCCNELGAKCYQKNDYWASCKTSCTEGIDPTDPPEFATPWTCKVLSKEAYQLVKA